jgi:hypothetical protein
VSGGTNGQGARGGGQAGAGAPDISEVVEHLRAASQEIAAAGKAFFDMVEQAMADLFNAMTGWSDPAKGRGGDKPKVERIDVEDERKPKEE